MPVDPSGTEEPTPLERTLADLEGRATELRETGWQVATVPAAHVTAEPPGAGESDRFGYVYVAPGSAAGPFREAFDAGEFGSFRLFRRTVGGTEYLLTELTDPQREIAILLAGGVENGDREAVRRAAEAEGAIGRFASLPRAVRPYVDPETTVPVDSVAGPVPDDPVAALVNRLVAVGLDAYAVRLTTRDLETIGFEAVRALVPAAQPLFVDEPYFGGRAERAPEAMGYEPRLARQHHPFP